MRNSCQKVIPFNSLASLSQLLKSEHRRIVTTNGCFDLMHLGHIQYLEQSKALGDILIVGINSDSSVRALKGPTRPLWNEQIRALQLSALQAVDYVAIFEEATPLRFLEQVQPHIHTKGGDYLHKPLPEREVIEKQGGELICLPLVEGYSTTSLIERLKLLSDI